MFQDLRRARSRAVLVDWLLDVAEEFALRQETLFLAVDLLDRHLSCKEEETAWLQLLGTACVWTAAKMEEVFAPTGQDMINLTDQLYTTTQLVRMERHMLQTLQHSVVRPNTYTFLSALVHMSNLEDLYGPPPPTCQAQNACAMCYWESISEQQWGSAPSSAPSSSTAPAATAAALMSVSAPAAESQAENAWARSKGSHSYLSLASSLSCGTQIGTQALENSLGSQNESLAAASAKPTVLPAHPSVGPNSLLSRSSPSRQSSFSSLPQLVQPARQPHARPQVISWLLGHNMGDEMSRHSSDSQLSAVSDLGHHLAPGCESPPRSSSAGLVCPNAPNPFRFNNPSNWDGEEMGPALQAQVVHSMCCEDEDLPKGGGSSRDGCAEPSAEDVGGLPDSSGQHMQMVYLARLMAEASLMEHKMLQHPPSQIAAACLMLARAMLSKPVWSPALAQQSGIAGPNAIPAVVTAVADAFAAVQHNEELVALQTRYGTRRMAVFFTPASHDALRLVESCRTLLACVPAPTAPCNIPHSQLRSHHDSTAGLSAGHQHAPVCTHPQLHHPCHKQEQEQQAFRYMSPTSESAAMCMASLAAGDQRMGLARPSGSAIPGGEVASQCYAGRQSGMMNMAGMHGSGDARAAGMQQGGDSMGSMMGSVCGNNPAMNLAAQLQAFSLGQAPSMHSDPCQPVQQFVDIHGHMLCQDWQHKHLDEQVQGQSRYHPDPCSSMWHASSVAQPCDFLDSCCDPVSTLPLHAAHTRTAMCSASVRARDCSGAASSDDGARTMAMQSSHGNVTCSSPISVLHLQGSWGAMTTTTTSSLEDSSGPGQSRSALQLMHACLSRGVPPAPTTHPYHPNDGQL